MSLNVYHMSTVIYLLKKEKQHLFRVVIPNYFLLQWSLEMCTRIQRMSNAAGLQLNSFMGHAPTPTRKNCPHNLNHHQRVWLPHSHQRTSHSRNQGSQLLNSRKMMLSLKRAHHVTLQVGTCTVHVYVGIKRNH